MSINRFAGGTLAAAILGGVPTAIGSQGLLHDDMDYLAQTYKEYEKGFASMSPEAQDAYITITANNKLSGLDRALVGEALEGQVEAPEVIKTEGARAIAQAVQLRQQLPEVAAEVSQLNQQELDLIVQEIRHNTTPQDVMRAEEQGAGVTPIPALVGGSLGTAAWMAMNPEMLKALRRS